MVDRRRGRLGLPRCRSPEPAPLCDAWQPRRSNRHQQRQGRGAITGLQGTHGVVFDDSNKYGYISDGRANAVVVFERATLKTIASIPAGTNPDGIAFEPVTKTVWAFNGRSKNVTVIDTKMQKVVATIDLPGKPEFPQADGKGMVFDNIEDTNQIVRLDAEAKKITATWPIPGCESPTGLAIDAAKRHLFPVCDGKKMAVVDADSGKVLATPAIGNGPDACALTCILLERRRHAKRGRCRRQRLPDGTDGTYPARRTDHGL